MLLIRFMCSTIVVVARMSCASKRSPARWGQRPGKLL
jgi:hypothetical protein